MQVFRPAPYKFVLVIPVHEARWPALDPAKWGPTKRTLHLIAQVLGKVRLALAPYQPNFFFSALYITPRGFTTSAIPVGFRLVEMRLDVFDARIELTSSDGGRRDVALFEQPTIAAMYEALLAALADLGVKVTISPIPQEIPDVTPLDRDDRPIVWVASDVLAWLTVMCSAQAVFDRWRERFFGRSGVQFWWGAFDLSLLLFTGKHVDPPTDRGYLIEYDLDAEMMSAGFYPGDDANGAFFYAYIYPEPARCADITIAAEGAEWSESLHEWILPYDTLRRSADPERMLRTFLSAVYDVCGDAAHWDRSQYTYVPPPLRHGTTL
jgi:hypothetical protein